MSTASVLVEPSQQQQQPSRQPSQPSSPVREAIPIAVPFQAVSSVAPDQDEPMEIVETGEESADVTAAVTDAVSAVVHAVETSVMSDAAASEHQQVAIRANESVSASVDVEMTSDADQAVISEDPVVNNDTNGTIIEDQQQQQQQQSFHVRGVEDDARALALAQRRLQIQLAFVEKARQRIQEESHPDLLARLEAVNAERTRLLERASTQEAYWQHCTSVIFAYECEEASREFELNCERLRQEMLDEIHHEIELINEQRSGSAVARKTTRKTRSTRTKGGAEDKSFALDTAQKIKKRVGSVFQPLEKRLAASEVDHDLRELTAMLESATKKRRVDAINTSELPYVAKYHRANFLYRDFVFQEGDEVYVRNFLTSSEYVAVICSVTSTELFVLSEKGKYYRLVLMDLRQGRVLVSPLSAEQTAAVTERSANETRVAA